MIARAMWKYQNFTVAFANQKYKKNFQGFDNNYSACNIGI